MSTFRKNNSIFIEKKILEYYLDNSDSAERVFEIRYRLDKCNWFEEYIKYYYNSNKWYNIKRRTLWCKPDWWIDLIWENNYWNKIYIQCKKYHQHFSTEEKYKNLDKKWNIWVWFIRDFLWWVVSECNWCIWNNIEMIYVTTWRCTSEAKEFAKNNNIKLQDFRDVAIISKEYPLDKFLDDFKNDWWDINKITNKYYKKEEKINKNQLTIFNIEEIDIYNYFKNIIPEINRKEWVVRILNDYIKERNPKWWLKEFSKYYNDKECINIIEQKEYEINKWIKILGLK